MISLLTKYFIKDSENTASPKVRQAYGILCGGMGILFNILLFALKLLAGFFSNSIAIMADAFNNLSDAGSSIITLIGFKMAGQKPDPDHPFGHGRIEYISGLLVSIAILIMAFELVKSSLDKILHPEPVAFRPIIFCILAFSILVKFYMASYNRKISRKIDSAAMRATALDSLSDALATTVVLAAALISEFTGLAIDGYCGCLVGLFILYAGFNAVKDTVSPLLGTPPNIAFVKSIEEIVMSYEQVIGIHDLIVHDYGPGRLMISLHAEVSADGNMLDLHDTIDLIEHRLRNELSCDAVIHMDPIANHDEETIRLKEQTVAILLSIDASLSLHDFRIVKGPTHTNIIFDIVVPYTFTMSDIELKNTIAASVKAINPNYFTVIEIDHSYCPS